ncbi:uncharacterized protein LOC121257331 [Juglans microcarpa x Juglans regia]|uniref:uncharacterized protein LOC121257331 n=1 Tax=Juglans microcarpa x Juglans regia TaxID=2249226 RepID=UPI001B7EC0B2|nr:uncharacterized protein LOC121257331 [Juglans microcarpa x Juglans regia]
MLTISLLQSTEGFLDSHTSFAPKEPKATIRMSSRHRPLQTCGVSILATARSAYNKAQDFNGPIGSTTRRIAKLVSFTSPLSYALLYPWLAILSFVDDQILLVENVVENIFPPSNYLFNKIDYVVQIIEIFPEKFDYALGRYAMIAHQVHFDCTLVHIVCWLNFFITTLTHLGSESTREKEILVDINFQDKPALVDEAKHADVGNKMEYLPPIPETPQAETETVNAGSGKATYKQVLEKGTKGNKGKKSGRENLQVVKHEITSVGQEVSWKIEEEIVDKKRNVSGCLEPAVVDVANQPLEFQANENSETEEDSPPIEAETETVGKTVDAGIAKGTYKEVLKRGTEEDMQSETIEERVENAEDEKATVGNGEEEITAESQVKDDPILELFEAGWLMNGHPGRRG